MFYKKDYNFLVSLKSKHRPLDVFDCKDDYRAFLRNWLEANQERIKGIQSRLADAIGCNPPFVSHVLSDKNHLSPEQALRATRFLNLNALESRYFMALVQFERAGTPDLKAYLKAELDKIRGERHQITARLGLAERLKPEHEARYYSHWLYAAIHIGLFVPEYRNPDVLADALSVRRETVVEVIHFLEEAGLATARGDGTYAGAKPDLHLPQDSEQIQSLHSQWRLRALRDPVRSRPQDVHYSLVLAIAEKDRERFRELILRTVEEAQRIMKASSPEERLFGLNLDFFGLTD